MSAKVIRRLRDALPGDEAVWNPKTIAALAVILVCRCLLFYGAVKVFESRVDSLPKQFEGRILEKHRGGSDTESSSYRYYRLTIEIEGQRLAVPVNPDIYQQAEVGMILKRSEKGLEVVRARELR